MVNNTKIQADENVPYRGFNFLSNFNKLSIRYQLHSNSTKIDAFKQKNLQMSHQIEYAEKIV